MALRGRQKRVAQGLSAPQVGLLVLRIGLVAVATLVAVWVLNDDRGVPLAALILVGFCLVFFYITTRTTFGRHIFAVGGNAEAARRAGIQRHARARDRVHDRLDHGRDRRHHGGVAPARGEPILGFG